MSNIYPVLLGIDNVGESVSFRKGAFQKLSLGKFTSVQEVIRKGYDVLFSDPDVAIIRDPLSRVILPGVDYAHSVNVKCQFTSSWKFGVAKGGEGNTGFYFLRSNPNTIKLYSTFLTQSVASPSDVDDQTLFWNYLFRLHRSTINSEGAPLRIEPQNSCDVPVVNKKLTSVYSCPLDFCEFASGILGSDRALNLTMAKLLQQQKDLFTAHANFMIGNAKKQERLSALGFWLATRSGEEGPSAWAGKCLQYPSPKPRDISVMFGETPISLKTI